MAKPADEQKDRQRIAIFIAAFLTVALILCTVTVLSSPNSLDERIWLVWLIFLGGLSKVLIANGLFLGLLHHDRQSQSELQLQLARRRATRSLPRLTRQLPYLAEVPHPRPTVRRYPLLRLAINRPPRPEHPREV
ncbi:MAG TPA: hypothetical protein VKV28_11435 [Candidatus Binataceae bacterium]|nr:hypothetical protein [Candidatus Binataceae bacterium]